MAPSSYKRLTVAIFVALVLLPAESLVIPALVGALGDDTTPVEWALSHAQEIPATTVDLKALPLTVRKAVMATLPPATRSRLWRAHFSEYIQQHEDLDATQLAILTDAQRLMSPSNMANRDNPDLDQAVREIAARAKSAFSPSDGTELFLTFGPTQANRHSITALMSRSAIQRLVYLFVLDAKGRPDSCSCSQEWGCGLSGPTCDLWVHCTPTDWGCGPFWWYSCDGNSC